MDCELWGVQIDGVIWRNSVCAENNELISLFIMYIQRLTFFLGFMEMFWCFENSIF
jgi:hypothetical protein